MRGFVNSFKNLYVPIFWAKWLRQPPSRGRSSHSTMIQHPFVDYAEKPFQNKPFREEFGNGATSILYPNRIDSGNL